MNDCYKEDLRIERMRLLDLGEVVRIERLCYRSPWPASFFANAILSRDSQPVVLRRKCDKKWRIVGYVVSQTGNVLHISNVAVDPPFRRLGYGRTLMLTALASGKEKGCFEASLEVRVSNTNAISLYRTLGFQETKTVKGYYPDTGEDCLIMELVLI